MKILYHHRTQAEDGQAVHIRSMIRAFEAEGHSVKESALVARSGSLDNTAGHAADAPSESLLGRFAGLLPNFARELAEYAYSWPATRRLCRDAREFEPDVLYERYAFGNAAGVRAAARLGLPLVLEVNSPMVLELSRTRGLSFPRMAARVEIGIFRAATRVCVVTQVLGDMLVSLGVEPGRIFVTPNGVHLDQYEYQDREAVRASALRDLGVPAGEAATDALVLGFVGYYRDWHRLDLVIEGLRDKELAKARFVLIGMGPAEEELREKARACGVAERVHFAGPRPHDTIPALLPAFDIALVPAINSYASPLKLHEYMAATLAIIAPDQANLREVLSDEQDALLVPTGDGDALLEAVLRLARDRGMRSRLARAARETIETRELTWRGNARRVVQAVESLS
ncbi:MAG: glycosyltransferase involved in cell wall biosynthesis [Planctomycetota bacterium]|jgi:glycosyltransferase involved in cell wall biosynthesis